jgi:ribosomal protein S18 acetylase RimI-like enzyme
VTSHPDAGAEPGRRLTQAQRLDLADPAALQQLWELQRAAYAVEAGLIGFDGIPPLRETLQELRDCGEAFLGVSDEAGLAGAVSWTRLPDGTLDICRLVVHPRAHRQGIATTLLDSLDAEEPASLTVVSTGTANRPALALYQRRGFLPIGQRQIAPGVTITVLERRGRPAADADPHRRPPARG